jgi:hypothetical protein
MRTFATGIVLFFVGLPLLLIGLSAVCLYAMLYRKGTHAFARDSGFARICDCGRGG